MNRKHFIRKTGAAAILISLGISLESCERETVDPVTPDNGNGDSSTKITFDISVSPYDALQNEDGWVLHPTENILLVNVSDTIRAFTSVCTHSGCSRDWSFSSQVFICGCHGSRFNNEGNVISGPASSSLFEFIVSREGNVVTIG